MKNTLKILRGLSVIGLMFSSVACSVDATGQGQAEEGTTSFAISDAAGTSSAKVTIYSDNPADLALTADDFDLVAITAEDAAAAQAADSAPSADPDEGDVDISDEVLAEGVVAVELVKRDAPDYRAPFRDHDSYSLAKDFKSVRVTRHALFNKVYVSVFYRTKKNGTWNTMVDEYKISNNRTYEVFAPESAYEIHVRVKARNTNDFDVEWVR